jgi:hypothetical protein
MYVLVMDIANHQMYVFVHLDMEVNSAQSSNVLEYYSMIHMSVVNMVYVLLLILVVAILAIQGHYVTLQDLVAVLALMLQQFVIIVVHVTSKICVPVIQDTQELCAKQLFAMDSTVLT